MRSFFPRKGDSPVQGILSLLASATLAFFDPYGLQPPRDQITQSAYFPGWGFDNVAGVEGWSFTYKHYFLQLGTRGPGGLG